MGSIATWDSMVKKFIMKFHHLSDHNDDEDVEEEEDPNETDNAPEIFMIEGNLFDFETPLCETFNEFNCFLKIDIDLFTYDIQDLKTYDEYEQELNMIEAKSTDEPWWYDELTDGKLKDEALAFKGKIEGSWGDKLTLEYRLTNPTMKITRYSNDLDFFKDIKNEFPAIVYNDALTSKSDFLTEPTESPQHIDEFNLKNEISLSECDEKEQNVLYFNDLFPFNVIYHDDLKLDKDNDIDEIDIEQSSEDMSVVPLPNVINTDDGAYALRISTIPGNLHQQNLGILFVLTVMLGVISVTLDEANGLILTQDTLRDALQITPVNNNRAFSSPPTPDTLVEFVNKLGYPKEGVVNSSSHRDMLKECGKNLLNTSTLHRKTKWKLANILWGKKEKQPIIIIPKKEGVPAAKNPALEDTGEGKILQKKVLEGDSFTDAYPTQRGPLPSCGIQEKLTLGIISTTTRGSREGERVKLRVVLTCGTGDSKAKWGSRLERPGLDSGPWYTDEGQAGVQTPDEVDDSLNVHQTRLVVSRWTNLNTRDEKSEANGLMIREQTVEFIESHEIDRKIEESVKEVVISSVKHAMRDPLCARFKDLPTSDMKEILLQRHVGGETMT
ncbi:hypothetical protein Tco_0982144 [Tanacetum coccineum]